MSCSTQQTFKERLDGYYDWPCAYLFKFIAPAELLDQVSALFAADVEIRTRHSKRGNYVSVTAEIVMAGSDEVIAIYERASEIDGVMPL